MIQELKHLFAMHERLHDAIADHAAGSPNAVEAAWKAHDSRIELQKALLANAPELLALQEQNERLRAALVEAELAINPRDRKMLSMAAWQDRLKAATDGIFTALNQPNPWMPDGSIVEGPLKKAREWWIASSPDFHGPVAFGTYAEANETAALEIIHVREVLRMG